MLRKKNYKDEDHFSQYYSAIIPRPNGSRLTVYYKRYRPAQKTHSSLYDALHAPQHTQHTQHTAQYPLDRTLEVLSFDGDLEMMKPLFKRIGKVRKFITGEALYSAKTAFTSIVIFKYEFDLVKCFRDEYFQEMANKMIEGSRPNEELLEEQRRELIATHLGDELAQANKLQQLYEEGYNPITNKFGEFKVDFEANQKRSPFFM